MTRLVLGSAAVAALILGGCTSLTARQDLNPADGAALTGVPYSLPMLQYDLAITRTLGQCVDPVTKEPSVKFTMEVEATPRYPAGETYVMDYRQLAGWTKVTSLAVEYQENSNVLKSINASAEDRTAAIAGNLVKSAVGVASLIGGIPRPSGSDGPPLTGGMMVCVEGKQGTQAKLDAIKVAAEDVKEKTEKLKAITAAVDALSARQSELSDADRTTLTAKLAQKQAATKALAESNEALAKLKSAVSYVAKTTWPSEMAETDKGFDASGPGLDRLARLVQWAPADGSENSVQNRCADATQLRRCVQLKLGAHAALVRHNIDNRASVQTGDHNSPAVSVGRTGVEGLLIRPPAYGRLIVCAATTTGCSPSSDNLVHRGDDVAIPQLGTLRFLPFRNQAFQNNAIALTMTPRGELAKLEYKNIKAQGEELSAAMLSAINDVRGFADARTAALAAREKKAHEELLAERAESLAAIQFEIEKAKKEQELADAQEDTSALATVQAETAATNARVALLQAQLAERQARAALEQ